MQVSIRTSSNLCGGTIVDSSHILSAAHCFYSPGGPPDPRATRVFAGNALMYQGNEFKVSSQMVYWTPSRTTRAFLGQVLSPTKEMCCMFFFVSENIS
jgi:secreted trypsin-like serine protease